MANPPVKKGLDSSEFKFLLECLDTGRCWTKLSPRYSDEATLPFSDTLPFIRMVVERYPTGCYGARTGRIRTTSSRC